MTHDMTGPRDSGDDAGASIGAVTERAPRPVTLAIADTTREDLTAEVVRAMERDPTFVEVDDAALADAVMTGAAEIAAATARWLAALAELVVRGVWAVDGAASPAVWLSWACGIAPSTAREHVRVALRLRDCPLVAERFAAGRLSYSKVRAITRTCTPESEPLLLAFADAAPAAVLERIVADTRRLQRAAQPTQERDDLGARRRWREDGTFELTVRVDAATGLGLEQHLDRLLELADTDGGRADRVDGDADDAFRADVDRHDGRHRGRVAGAGADAPRPSRAQRTATVVADALAAAVAAGPRDTSGADRHTVVVHLTSPVLSAPGDQPVAGGAAPTTPDAPDTSAGDALDTSAGDALDTSAGHEGHGARDTGVLVTDGRGRVRAMSARQARRLACSPTLRLIGGTPDNPADLGRSRRDPDAALRRLLMARDRTCRFPGCGATRHLHAHHVRWWSDGGATDLSNLVLLCRHHHSVVHDHGWQLRATDRIGRWTFHPPPSHPAADDGPWPWTRPTAGASAEAVRRAAAVHAPDIGPTDLVPPHWDGLGYDHDMTVAVLFDRVDAA